MTHRTRAVSQDLQSAIYLRGRSVKGCPDLVDRRERFRDGEINTLQRTALRSLVNNPGRPRTDTHARPYLYRAM